MELAGRTVALYGRFSAGLRDRLAREVLRQGGAVARDFTRQSDALVIGGLATGLIDSGALGARLAAAHARGVRVYGERSFAGALTGKKDSAPPTYPLASALSNIALSRDDAEIFAAFDLAVIDGDQCRFADVAVLRTAAELREAGSPLSQAARILMQARDTAPTGRRRLVVTSAGPALQWDDGLTTLDGQGYLPLASENASIDDLFEAAMQAEADGDDDEAARLYENCARLDKKDPLACFNLANILLRAGRADEAAMAYQRALARDPRLNEARYNLAQALEAAGKLLAAEAELEKLVASEPDYADALFNLAQLRLKRGLVSDAKELFERYLACDPPADWAATARKAITYCVAKLSA
jgi:tetratricopeptide (TPR) repeat protein